MSRPLIIGRKIVDLKIVGRKIELIAALLGAAIFVPMATAQMRPPAMAALGQAPSSFPSALGASGAVLPQHNVNTSLNEQRRSHSFGPVLLGTPFLYADYPTQPLTIQSVPPPVVIVQPTSTPDALEETKSEPLLIELRGNRYVRYGGTQKSAERGTNAPPDYAESDVGKLPRLAQSAPPPTVLIFRDGHREQVPEYAIISGILYASGDYWQSGHWTKTIQLSALDIAATVRANQENAVKFMLPSAPNEVVVTP
jgi:hypothetical protein